MSFHYMGISHFPVLHRQFSPSMKGFSGSSPTQDVSDDNKDVLVERLNDLMLRLINNNLNDNVVSALHSKVDEVELIIRGSALNSPNLLSKGDEKENRNEKKIREITKEPGEDLFWGPPHSPFTPPNTFQLRFPDQSPPIRVAHIEFQKSLQTDREMVTRLDEINSAANSLVESLMATIKEFQARKEESYHIRTLLITRLEKAAQRIIQLESRISEMEEDSEASKSDLKFLRIQLAAIEAQSSPRDRDRDQELSESIRSWKVAWQDIDRKMRTPKRNEG
ncbi:hypothetical protein B7494_g6924 [Chlorociboria aeruginascens]|nr:hypothetical protein B7494_g6924 [Chlorociboria aeruginascens]